MINQEASFAGRLITWQIRHGRHDLPWQGSKDPYPVWLSEIMLQQTQVATVAAYFERFMRAFPTLADLAAAPQGDVMAAWSGLGYYARARNLHACAQKLQSQHGGDFPRTAATLATFPGIGRSTANAIAAFCFDEPVAILDGNVKRVLCRHFGVSGFPGSPAVERELWLLAESLLPESGIAHYIQAQMDLGATLCTRSKPACSRCPVAASCVALAEGRTEVLPSPRPRRALPERQQQVLLLLDRQRVLLLWRPAVGIWGGLLSLPELPDGQAAAAYAEEALGCAVAQFEELPPLQHSFTHFRLTLLPLRGQISLLPRVAEGAGTVWMGRDELAAAALPAPIRKLLLRVL